MQDEKTIKRIFVESFKTTYGKAKILNDRISSEDSEDIDGNLVYEAGRMHGKNEAFLEVLTAMYGAKFALDLWKEISGFAGEWGVKQC